MSLRIEMLPAVQGDALWIEYGSPVKRILFDVGTPGTAKVVKERIEQLPPADRVFELLVVTHIDSDHIGGAIPLLEDRILGASFKDIWFNGWRHLHHGVQPLGPTHGDRLTALLQGLPWNVAWNGGPIAVPDEAQAALPSARLEGGLCLTVLSPFAQHLADLRTEWPQAVKDHGLVEGHPPVAPPELPPSGDVQVLGPRERPVPATPQDLDDIARVANREFDQDIAKPNGSSIAVLMEYEGSAVMLTADAYPKVLLRSLDRLLGTSGNRLKLDAFKLPHHGSKANLHLDLLQRIDCPRHLISTNGTQTSHPHIEAIARVLLTSPERRELIFNYRSQWNAVWDDDEVAVRGGYARSFPPKDGPPGIVVEIG